MKRLFLLAGVFLTIYAPVSSQSKGLDARGFPVYDSVVRYISHQLTVSDIGEYQQYRLGKKPDGWHVYVIDYLPDSTGEKNDRLCWSTEKRGYMDLGALRDEVEVEKVKKQLIVTGFNLRDFELMPYYGYAGWYDDVIGHLKDSVKLCDLNLFALSRAYAYKSYGMLDAIKTYTDPSQRFGVEDKPDCMSPKQLEEYRRYGNLAIETDYKLWKQNPGYETYIGSVYNEYSNEAMTLYLNVAYYQNTTEAQKDLRPDLYDPFLIAFAKNLLNSCAPNAILFTQGDNDTYPLYYAQAALGVRRDVLLVNVSLLGTGRYINFVRRGVYDAKPFPLSLKPEQYAGSKLDYLLQSDELYKKVTKIKGLDFTVTNPTLYKNDIMLLDMVATNKGKRPMNFAVSVAPDVFLGMEKYLEGGEGMTYRLTSEIKSDAKFSYNAPMNAAFSLDYFKNKFAPVDWKHQAIRNTTVNLISSNYRGTFCNTCEALIKKGKLKEAKELMDMCLQDFPDSIIPLNVFIYTAPEIYFKCGDKKHADLTASLLIKNAMNVFEKVKSDRAMNDADWDRSMRESLFIMQELLNLYEREFPEDAITKKLNETFPPSREFYAKEQERRKN